MGNSSSRRHRHRAGLIALAVFALLLTLPARADDGLDGTLGDPGRTFPNLVPDVSEVSVELFSDDSGEEEGLFLWFDTRAQNRGTVPVQVTMDEVESPSTSTVSQCVSWRSPENHLCRETEVVGGYTWHEEHTHFHYVDFASYELRALLPDGTADYSEAGLLRSSGKMSFCFYDIEQVDDAASAAPFYTTGGCVAPIVMGISPGWTDIYSRGLPGQSIDIEGLPTGEYALTTALNFEQTLRETDYDDDFVEVRIRITDTNDIQFFSGKKAEIVGKRRPTAAERAAVPTTVPTTTTTTVVTTTTSTTAPGGMLPDARIITARPAGTAPVLRRRPAPPRAGECPLFERSCTRAWSTGP